MKRRLPVAALVGGAVIVVILVAVFASRFGRDPGLSPSPLIGTQVPDLSLQTIEGGVELALRDQGMTVVNFWAPWCVPCRAEHAALVEAAQTYDEFSVTIIGVAYQSEVDNVVAFLDELGRGYPIAMDDRSRAAIAFGVRGVPETFFIDTDGTVVAKVNGPVDLGLVTATLDAIILGNAVDSTTTGETQISP